MSKFSVKISKVAPIRRVYPNEKSNLVPKDVVQLAVQIGLQREVLRREVTRHFPRYTPVYVRLMRNQVALSKAVVECHHSAGTIQVRLLTGKQIVRDVPYEDVFYRAEDPKGDKKYSQEFRIDRRKR